MILKALRIRSTSGISRTIRHLQNGDDNELVSFLHGTPNDIRDMHRDAIVRGSTYSVRHWIIAPHELMDRAQLQQLIGMVAKNFAFDADRAVVVEHRKPRSVADAVDVHWHMLVGEVNPATGHVLRSSFDRVIHELIARVSEYTFGHRFVLGKHTQAVIKGLRRRKLACIADSLEKALLAGKAVPAEAFTHAQHQEKKRLGLDLPAVRQTIKEAASHATSRNDLTNRLSEMGLEVREGDKPGTWLIVHAADGILVGALHRLASKRRSEINILMERNEPAIPQATPPISATAPKGVEHVETSEREPHQRAQDVKPYVSSVAADLATIVQELDRMEQAAQHILHLPVPQFRSTRGMRNASQAVRAAKSQLSAAADKRWDIQERLWKAPRVRWWSYLVGTGVLRHRQIQDLETALAKAIAEQRVRELALSACQSRETQEEKKARDEHVANLKNVTQQHRSAQETLRLVEAANVLLSEKPNLARGGIEHLLAQAKILIRVRSGTDNIPEKSAAFTM